MKFPQNLYSQEELIGALTDFAGPEFQRFALSSGVASRHTALPLTQYKQLNGFTDANETFLEVALHLAEQALRTALVERVGLRQDVKRVPLFGPGCVAGAAGVVRMHDYLRAFPDRVAAKLAVELCSLSIQHQDNSVVNLVATSLFGDAAGTVIAKGASRAAAEPSRPGHPEPDLPRHRRSDGLEDRQ